MQEKGTPYMLSMQQGGSHDKGLSKFEDYERSMLNDK
jgi:hypothetical protein